MYGAEISINMGDDSPFLVLTEKNNIIYLSEYDVNCINHKLELARILFKHREDKYIFEEKLRAINKEIEKKLEEKKEELAKLAENGLRITENTASEGSLSKIKSGI